MTWAMRRRLIILGIIAAAIAAALAAFYFTTIHQAPSCTDAKQNQGEEGVDCGGPCRYLCTDAEAAPSVRFVRALAQAPGRVDAVAYIDNPNADAAARSVPYTLELYDAHNTVLGKREGVVDLPPSATVPVFIPAAYQGTTPVARAFLTFDAPPHLWYRYTDTRVKPVVENTVLTPGAAPRITATAANPSTSQISDAAFIATVFNADGNAIAASRTVVARIPGQGRVPLVFTWNAPFPDPVSRIEVLPVVPLP